MVVFYRGIGTLNSEVKSMNDLSVPDLLRRIPCDY